MDTGQAFQFWPSRLRSSSPGAACVSPFAPHALCERALLHIRIAALVRWLEYVHC